MSNQTIYQNKYCKVDVAKNDKGKDVYAVIIKETGKIAFEYKTKQDALKYAHHLESYAPMWVRRPE